jgi:hypothetical protein
MNIKQDARKLDLYGKEDLRRRVIQAVTIENVSVTQAARLFGVSRTAMNFSGSSMDLCRDYGKLTVIVLSLAVTRIMSIFLTVTFWH